MPDAGFSNKNRAAFSMDIFSVTAPLTIRLPDGEKQLIIAKFPHKLGLLYFVPYFHLMSFGEGVHLIQGDITGEGPWKVGNAVITVTGCHGSDPEMAAELASWQQYLMAEGQEERYSDERIRSIARQLGAIIK